MAVGIFKPMATAKLYLDTRRASADTAKPVRLKISINHRKSTGYLSLNLSLLPEQWDKKKGVVINHPEKAMLNAKIAKMYGDVTAILFRLSQSEDIDEWTNSELCSRIKRELGEDPSKKAAPKKKKDDTTSVKYWYDKWVEHKAGGTKLLYDLTRKRLVKYVKGEEAFGKMHFEDITRDWLIGFDADMKVTAKSANTRAIAMRCLRTVCNYAIDNEVTTYYPFRRFKIETAKTRKRNFDVHILRRILIHKCDEDWQDKYLDYFRLTFMLIGINSVDLYGLEKVTQGRVNYTRAKTHKPYSIKVEPEAQYIIDKYQGKKKLLDFCEKFQNHTSFYGIINRSLNTIKQQLGLEELSTYWARHSWATIARKLGISKDTIGLGLGHSTKSVTDIYIDYDPDEVDIANRKVLDWVLWGKIDGKVVEQPGTDEFFGITPEEKKRGRPKKEATKK